MAKIDSRVCCRNRRCSPLHVYQLCSILLTSGKRTEAVVGSFLYWRLLLRWRAPLSAFLESCWGYVFSEQGIDTVQRSCQCWLARLDLVSIRSREIFGCG